MDQQQPRPSPPKFVECGGVYLPPGEKHLVEWMRKRNQVVNGKLTYQFHKLDAAVKLCRQRRGAIDVGAHCGLWSMHLADLFQHVIAIEPVEIHRECFRLNVQQANVMLEPCALGERDGLVSMKTEASSSGDTTVAGPGEIPMVRLDDMLPDETDIDLIKLDCEGYELFALRGGEQLLKRCRPIICVEQKPGKGKQFGLGETDAVEYLKTLGYGVAREISGDFIMVPK